MNRASIRFYAELNDFLASERRWRDSDYRFYGAASVKEAIEALGVPHTEVDLILVNGESADFSHLLMHGDRVSVYPVFEGIDITPLVKVRPKPLRVMRFVLDGHLGRLAAYLRMLGFDTLYENHPADEELARISASEHRVLLTRDRGLLMRKQVTHGYAVRHTQPRLQLAEVIERFDLRRTLRPFSRCLACNALLEALDADYTRCPGCRRLYWKGSHYRRMRQILESAAGYSFAPQ